MKLYKVSDLMRTIEESAKNEFKPVFGKGVTQGNKVNDKAYADMNKETQDYYKGIADIKQRAAKGYDYSDGKGMTDLQFTAPVDPKRVKDYEAQLKGYVSAEAEKLHKNDEFGNADFGTDKSIKQFKNNAKQHKDNRTKATMIGLTGRELNKQDVQNVRHTVFGENKLRRFTFKNTQFISESDMLAKVPDEVKVEGKRFVMRDANRTEYLVEWHKFGPDVTKQLNPQLVNEELNKIKKLYGFERGENKTTPHTRIQENTKFSDVLGRARSLMN